MLTNLYIRNYALIDELSFDLRPGLTVLTGETGAGKSIIIGALSLLLGHKPDPDMIRSNSDYVLVEGVFEDIGRSANVCQKLGIELPEQRLVICRRFDRYGRGSIHANDSPITLTGLQSIGELLVDLHGQHQHQYLLRPHTHLELLDAHGGLTHERIKFAEMYSRHTRLKSELARLEEDLNRRRNQQELMEYQWQELNGAAVTPGLTAELTTEQKLLASSERRFSLASQLVSLLSEQEGSATDVLSAAARLLAELIRLDPDLADARDTLDTVRSAVDDLWRTLLTYRDSISFSAERLEEINARLFTIQRLEKKYGVPADELNNVADLIRRELDTLQLDESRVSALREEITMLERELCRAAASLSKARLRTKADFEKRLGKEFAQLGLPGARLSCQLARIAEPDGLYDDSGARCHISATGIDVVEFLFSANIGEEPRPLRKIASGGELSRIMLAIKTVLAAVDPIPTLVFDEIDTGIGGSVAEAVGRHLAELGKTHQVICITHLPQIARHANDHLQVAKRTRSGRTVSLIRRLTKEERIAELARMSCGDRITAAGLAHAREMLRTVRVRRTTDAAR
ncbi:MAG: DNA repair protein RecN [candidate division WOR-3 bacterium]